MINIDTFVLGAVKTNCYLLSNPETKEGILLDPADNAEYITKCILEKEINLKGIYLTHGHFDHMLASSTVASEFRVPICCLQAEKEVAESTLWNLSDYFGYSCMVAPNVLLADGVELEVLGTKMRVLHTPGHTKGSGCYYFEEEGILFSGDTLFFESVGRTDFPTGNERVLEQSIQEKLYVLPDKTKVYAGHGPSTTIGYEKQNNMLVRAK